MGEQITLDADFLRRALGQEGDLIQLGITPGSLTPDFPVKLPDSAGSRVLGGVRSVAFRRTPGEPTDGQTTWRVFLDLPGLQPDVMAALTAHLERQGWRAAQPWRQAFVEAEAGQWMGVHAGQERTVMLQARGEGGVTQISLNVQDVEPEQVQHMLGQSPHSHFHRMHDLPLPTLTAPQGWRVQMQGGGGGEAERSERVILVPPEDVAGQPDLLAHFRPQLERQEWRVLHVADEGDAAYLTARTTQGVGVLTLGPKAGAWQAVLLHFALGPGGQASASFYTLSSRG
ncbi:hypothetical protein DAETH_25210 [Deinococcus aetherius]|uniref:Uncharacterized protein n=1 Tax=Deinococcus aetherius TaxID=200252 RepID=A0ABN6RGQ2_9DEIO|nr:hypothetical protein [Deinococcus aetherius]BDP42552.1 hypothetical protein DAETH_25210 [Deinococcus aetherius]